MNPSILDLAQCIAMWFGRFHSFYFHLNFNLFFLDNCNYTIERQSYKFPKMFWMPHEKKLNHFAKIKDCFRILNSWNLCNTVHNHLFILHTIKTQQSWRRKGFFIGFTGHNYQKKKDSILFIISTHTDNILLSHK